MDDGEHLRAWTLHDASARLEEMLRDAETGGPQRIEKDGMGVGYGISGVDYERLLNAPAETWVDRLSAAADGGFDFDCSTEVGGVGIG